MTTKRQDHGTDIHSCKPCSESGALVPQRSAISQAVTIALVVGGAPGVALAQAGELEEIIVTATKRAESVMDVPLAISAMSGAFIRDANLNDIKDLIFYICLRGLRTLQVVTIVFRILKLSLESHSGCHDNTR